MGWASRVAADIQAAENARNARRQWTIFAAQRIEAEADALWGSVTAQVESDVREFDEALHNHSGLKLEKIGPHNVTVTRLLAPILALRFVYTPNHDLAVFWNDRLVSCYRFLVEEDGTVWFADGEDHPMTAEKISSLSFDPLVEVYKHSI